MIFLITSSGEKSVAGARARHRGPQLHGEYGCTASGESDGENRKNKARSQLIISFHR
jgi:hypothetical protein